MNKKLAFFEKFTVAPSPSRDYYGLKVFRDEVIVNIWKISHGPHVLPVIRAFKFPDFNENQTLKEELEYVFGELAIWIVSQCYLNKVSKYLFKFERPVGPDVLKHIKILIDEGTTLLTLPKSVVEKLVRYLSLPDLSNLLCASKICNQIFDANSVWESVYKKLKRSCKLTEMEKDMGITHGYKKLVKDHQMRKIAKKHLKALDEKAALTGSATFERNSRNDRNEKIARSASVPKAILKNEEKNIAGHRITAVEGTRIQKSVKSPKLKALNSREKKITLPKKSTSEGKSSISIENRNFNETHAAGEGYRPLKLIKEASPPSAPIAQRARLQKYEFVSDENEKTELLLQKEVLKSAILNSDISDVELEELMKLKSAENKGSPRNGMSKSAHLGLKELEAKSKEKEVRRSSKGSKKKASKSSKSGRYKLKSALSSDKIDDSDGSGMSYLMKRYLEASGEVARKFSECERLAHSTKNSSTQVDLREKCEPRQQRKSTHHNATALQRSTSRNAMSNTNLFPKLRSHKKN